MRGGWDWRGCRGGDPLIRARRLSGSGGAPHTPSPGWGGHRRWSPGTMEGVWPKEAKGSVCPDSCCSFAICPGSGRRRKETLEVMAEGPLSPPGTRHWHSAPPRTGTPLAAPIPAGTEPVPPGSRGGLPWGHTHLCGTDPAVLALHGEALQGGRKGHYWSQVVTPASGHPPGQGGHPEPTGITPRQQRLGSPATPCSQGGCGLLPGWQRAGWCPGRGRGGRGWWPPSEATGEGRKEVEGIRDEAECSRSPMGPPRSPLLLHAPSKLDTAPSTTKAGCSYRLPCRGIPVPRSEVGRGSPREGGWAACAPLGWARGSEGTSRMTAQICLTHWMMVSGTPETVTARSVELGSRSPATCTCAPVLWVREAKGEAEVLQPPPPQASAGRTSPVPSRASGTFARPTGVTLHSSPTSHSPWWDHGSPMTGVLCYPGKRGACTQGTLGLTSRISRIFAPALPMSEPH